MTLLVGTSTKMNLTSSEVRDWCQTVRGLVDGLTGVSLFVLPSFPAIWAARDALSGGTIAWGAQDVHPGESGAHTGDVSASMLADLGCTFVEVGHSERRRDHGETDHVVAAKVAAILRAGMQPILCVGEAEPGWMEAAGSLVANQVLMGLEQVVRGQLGRVIVAYEPVWAIGSGSRPASPDHVRAVHAAIHRQLTSMGDRGSVPVIYGGSVDAASAEGILKQPGVDGLFVGRAALDPNEFVRIAAVASGVAARSGSSSRK